jgi:hypothetical protein
MTNNVAKVSFCFFAINYFTFSECHKKIFCAARAKNMVPNGNTPISNLYHISWIIPNLDEIFKISICLSLFKQLSADFIESKSKLNYWCVIVRFTFSKIIIRYTRTPSVYKYMMF